MSSIHLTAVEAARAAPQAPAQSTPPRRDGFFRHHGLWAPGVRLFRVIGFNTKAAIIALTFLLPLGVLSWNYFCSQAEQIQFSAKELEGTAYARSAYALLPPLLQWRRQASAPQPAATTPLAEPLARLKAAEADHGASLGTTEAHQALSQAMDSLAQPGADAPQRASAAIEALINLIGVASDGSNLTLDPDIDTYYLMDAAMFKLPGMIEAAGQLGTLGAQVLQRHGATPAQTRRLIEQAAILGNGLAGLQSGIAKAQAYNADVKQRVPAQQAYVAVSELARLLEQTVLAAGGPQGQPEALAAAADRAIDAMGRLNEQSLAMLDTLIAARVGRIVSARNLTFVLVCFSLITALYLFTSFRKVLHGGLKEVAFHIDQMRDGNLTTQPHAWGADEAAGVIRSLRQMQEALRELVVQVRHASDGIVTASGEIATGAQDLSLRTEQSAAHLAQTTSTMAEVADSVRRNEGVIVHVADLATHHAQAAQRGGEAVQATIVHMQGMNQAAHRIGDIVGTIDTIAFQTNILALNAAVEAARAGEHGKGFAVVAAEVRMLAGRSAEAAREIRDLIGDSVAQVRDGLSVVQQAGDLMAEVLQSTQTVNARLQEAVAGAEAQSRHIAGTHQAIQVLDSATQQNAALVEQAAASAAAMQQQAEALANDVARFKLPQLRSPA